MKDPCILITGATGLLAPYLIEAASPRGRVVTTARRGGNTPCDLADVNAVEKLLSEVAPDIVVHAAALTDVEECERDPAAADIANRRATAFIASALGADATLMYISTDQVYANDVAPHVEGSEAPLNVYGTSKLAGERAVLHHPGGLAARTNFFAASKTLGRSSLSDFFIESLSHRRNVTLYRDTWFSPLHATTLASILFDMIEARLRGAYNIASREGCSKADFALKIAARFELQTETATIADSTTIPGRTRRSADLRMDPGRIEAALGRRMPTLDQEIDKL